LDIGTGALSQSHGAEHVADELMDTNATEFEKTQEHACIKPSLAKKKRRRKKCHHD